MVIGCGNIGAGYDFDSEAVFTHAKALHQNPAFDPTFCDLDVQLAEKVAKKYNASWLPDNNYIDFKEFDCISICTPTVTHHDFLMKAFEESVPLVICEKPVASTISELDQLKALFTNSKTSVLVNYMRRFLPCFEQLKEKIDVISGQEKLTNVMVQYQRGIVNNAGHALDLISYLFDKTMQLENVLTNKPIHDAFQNDPTLSLFANWNNANLAVIGLSDVKFSFFEIDLIFEYYRISIIEAGKTIKVQKAPKAVGYFRPLESLAAEEQTNCLDDYMIPVINKAKRILSGVDTQDNFLEALEMNKEILKYINI